MKKTLMAFGIAAVAFAALLQVAPKTDVATYQGGPGPHLVNEVATFEGGPGPHLVNEVAAFEGGPGPHLSEYNA